MNNKLFVGNLEYSTTQEELEALFQNHGTVQEARIIKDRETGRPRGFAFVTFEDGAAAQSAAEALNGQDFNGRTLSVNEAKESKSFRR